MGQDDVDGDGLNELRASLARFVLREAGHAAAEDPSLPLYADMVAAMREEMQKAAEAYLAALPPARKLAEAFIADIEPELLRITAAGAGQDKGVRRGLGALIPSGRWARLAILIAAALVLATGGFLTGRWSASAGPPEQDEVAATAPETTGVEGSGAEAPPASAAPGTALARIAAANEAPATARSDTTPQSPPPAAQRRTNGADQRPANARPAASQTTGDTRATAPAGDALPSAPAPASETN